MVVYQQPIQTASFSFIHPPTHPPLQVITVYDLKGAQMGDLQGEAKVFLKKGLGLIQTHYPERSR